MLTLDDANRVMQAAIKKAAELDFAISVAVVDSGGRLVAFARMDEGAWAANYGAIGKAVLSSAFAGRTESLEKIAETPIMKGIMEAAGGGMVPAAGAVPLKRDGIVIGAVGVGGARGGADVDIADAAADVL